MAFPSGKRWTFDSSTASSSRPCKVVRPGEGGGSPTKSIVSQTGSGTSSPAKGVSHALKRFFRTRKSSKQKTKTGDGDSISNSATPPKNKRSLPDNSENVCYDQNPGDQAAGMDDFHRRDVQFLELMYGGQGMPHSSSRAAEPQESADVASNGFLKYRHRYSKPIQIQTRHSVPVKKRILLTPSSPASFTSPSDGEMPSSTGDERKRERRRVDSTELTLETEVNGGKYEDELLFQIEMDSLKSENGGENNASRRQTDPKSSVGPSESTRSRKNAPSMQGRRSLVEALEKETEENKRRRAPKDGSDFVDQEFLEESLRTAAILADEGWKREQNEVKLQRRSSIHGSNLFLNRI